jgi:hypothetical protein
MYVMISEEKNFKVYDSPDYLKSSKVLQDSHSNERSE